nr:NAD(+)--rifampin ADP-ribosyltransferase [Bradyrhizobium canariense]
MSGTRLSYHGTRADLKPGDLIAAGFRSNYERRAQASWLSHGYFGSSHLGRRAGTRRRRGENLHRRADRGDRG